MKKRGRPTTFSPRTRKYFARLIGQHGVSGACRNSAIPVSRATLLKVAKEFDIRLRVGRRHAVDNQISPPKFTAFQKVQIEQILARGPIASGYRSDRWTCRRITEVVRRSFGLECHAIHLKQILSKLGIRVVECSVITLRKNEAVETLLTTNGGEQTARVA
jgi:transposase